MLRKYANASILLLVTVAVFPQVCFASDPWDAEFMDNGLIRLEIVPEIGGRITRFSLEDYQYFLVNRELDGKAPPESRLDDEGGWLNYGGDKLWVAPQGWNGEHEWPGPPDTVLDGGLYEYEVLQTAPQGSARKIRLTSDTNASSGVQLSRTVELFEGTSRVHIEATMTNVGEQDRRWGIWAHTQLEATNSDGEGVNPSYKAYCPVNPDSIFPKGYDVIFGMAQNPSFCLDEANGMVTVQQLGLVGKIGVDSKAGWLASVDGESGYAFIQKFQYEEGREYPDNSSVEFWLDGEGEFYAYGERFQIDEPLEQYCFESEMIGPYESLSPDQSASFSYDWYATNIGGDFPIVDCNEHAAIVSPLKLEDQGRLTAHLGIFYEGEASAIFTDSDGQQSQSPHSLGSVSPRNPVQVNIPVVTTPATTRIELQLIDTEGNIRVLSVLTMKLAYAGQTPLCDGYN